MVIQHHKTTRITRVIDFVVGGEKDEDGDIDNASEGTVVIPENVTATKERTPPSTEEQEKRLG